MKHSAEILPVKDDEQRPIPTAWGPLLTQVVSAFKRKDYVLMAGVPGVESPSIEEAEQIRDYIADYGTTLVELPEGSWESSVCMWYGTHRDALFDLWTEAEGRSDLVLHARIVEVSDGFAFKRLRVYVP